MTSFSTIQSGISQKPPSPLPMAVTEKTTDLDQEMEKLRADRNFLEEQKNDLLVIEKQKFDFLRTLDPLKNR